MKTAKVYEVDGREFEVAPNNGTDFTLAELQHIVGGTIECINLPSGKMLICNEEGRLIPLAKNAKASEVWRAEFPIEQYPDNNEAYEIGVMGNVVICDPELIK